jgi:hypothetical protein
MLGPTILGTGCHRARRGPYPTAPPKMHIWTALVAREAALLTILTLFGSGPASLLSERFDAAARIALAPVLGFCLGTCVTTTVIEFAPARDTYWMLIPLALASAGVAAARTVRSDGRGAA